MPSLAKVVMVSATWRGVPVRAIRVAWEWRVRKVEGYWSSRAAEEE